MTRKSNEGKRRLPSSIAWIACALLAACAQKGPPVAVTCCPTIGYSRAQVESVLGAPLPPQSSKAHPFPSPPPNAPIYTTEHGYLTVTYNPADGVATSLSMNFYEGKAPDDAFHLMTPYLPRDAVDTKSRVSGSKANIRIYSSNELARRLPATGGTLYVECTGAQPALLCEDIQVFAAGRI